MSYGPLPKNETLTTLKITSQQDVTSDNQVASFQTLGGALVDKQLVTKGLLTVKNDAVIEQNLTVIGLLSAGSLSFDSETVADLVVSNSAIFNGTAEFTNISTFQEPATFNAPTFFTSELVYSGTNPAVFNSIEVTNLEVTNDGQIDGDLNVTGSISAGSLSFDAQNVNNLVVNLSSISHGTNSFTSSSSLSYVGSTPASFNDISITNDLSVSNDVSVTGSLTTDGVVYAKNGLQTGDNQTASSSQFVAGTITPVFGTYNNDGSSPYSDTIVFKSWGDATGGNDNMLAINKSTFGIRLYQDTFDSATPFSTYRDVVLANSSGEVTLSGALNITDTTSSTSTTTGSLITAGGVGIAENMHIGGTVYANIGQSLVVGDSVLTGDRLRMHHDGSNGYIDYGNDSAPNDCQLIFRADGVTTTLVLDADGDTVMSGNLNVSGTITGGTLTDGTASLASGSLTSAVNVTASGTVTGGTLTDGTASLASGSLTSAVNVTASGTVTGGTLTDGTASLASGSLTSAVNVTASGTVTGGTLTDGTASLASGSLTSAVNVTASGTITGGTLTDGTASLASGSLTSAVNVTASGTITGGTLTDGTASLASGSLTGVVNVTASGNVNVTGNISVGSGSFFYTAQSNAKGRIWEDGNHMYIDNPSGENNIYLRSDGTTDMLTINGITSVDIEKVLNVNDNTSSISTTTGSIVADGGVGVAENINAGGIIKTTATTTSASTTTGSIVAGGGVGIGENLFVGGYTSITGQLFVGEVTQISDDTQSSTTTGGALIVTGGVGVGKNINAGGIITGASLTDGTASLASGSLTSAVNVSASGTITGGTLTDGTASLASGSLTSAVNVTASGTVTGGTLTDGTASLASGSLTSAVNVTASNTITGGTLTDGIATLSGGELSDVIDVNVVDTVTSAIFTDGTASLEAGSLTGAVNVTASGIIKTTNSTNSTSPTTGALQVTGGVGIGDSLWCKNLYVSNTDTAFVGDYTQAGWVQFSHNSRSGNKEYSLASQSGGDTWLNSKSGSDCVIAVDDTAELTFNGSNATFKHTIIYGQNEITDTSNGAILADNFDTYRINKTAGSAATYTLPTVSTTEYGRKMTVMIIDTSGVTGHTLQNSGASPTLLGLSVTSTGANQTGVYELIYDGTTANVWTLVTQTIYNN